MDTGSSFGDNSTTDLYPQNSSSYVEPHIHQLSVGASSRNRANESYNPGLGINFEENFQSFTDTFIATPIEYLSDYLAGNADNIEDSVTFYTDHSGLNDLNDILYTGAVIGGSALATSILYSEFGLDFALGYQVPGPPPLSAGGWSGALWGWFEGTYLAE